MNRIKDYSKLKEDIVKWIKDYFYMNSRKCLVVGVSGGIDSGVVSTLCAQTGVPTYVVSLPLMSKQQNHRLSHDHCKFLEKKYENVTYVEVELSGAYDHFHHCLNWWSDAKGFKKTEFTNDELTNANTKARLRMITLYQIAGSKGGIVAGTGNKVEDYGVGFFTKYGDGGVDFAPIADLYKTEVRELGKELGVSSAIIEAVPTDGLWDDGRTDEDQLGISYEALEEAMEHGTGPGVQTLEHFNHQNQHKMSPIPTFKL